MISPESILKKITASDLETTLSAEIKIESEDNGFYCGFQQKLLIDTLKKLFPEQPLTFNILENNTIEN